MNHKKVERIWREEGLQLPQRHKKRRRLYHKDALIIRLRPTHPNHVWSIDFVHDKLDSGRSYKMLTVLDEYTRQALAVAVRTRMGADDVLEALYPPLLRHGTPEYIRSDNGPEFVAQAMQDWLARVGIKPIRIYPGSHDLLQPRILFLETAYLRQLRPIHPAEPLAPVIICRVADTRATTGRLHVAAVRQLHLNLPQQLKYVLV